jgi:hypothetical protein
VSYYDPHYEDTYEEVPDTQQGEIRSWPDCEGAWKLISTGEIAIASETTDIEDRPMFTILIDGEGPFFSIDMENEKFVKL